MKIVYLGPIVFGHLLWRATGDRAHLDEAKRLLDESLAAGSMPQSPWRCRFVTLSPCGGSGSGRI